MFKEHLKKFQKFFETQKNQTLFRVDTNRDKIWETYLNGFSEEDRQGNNCNCCKSFLRQYGGIVTIKNNKITSIWDFEPDEGEYKNSILALREYIHSLPIKDVYFADQYAAQAGVAESYDNKRTVNWNHYNFKLPTKVVVGGSAATKTGELRDNFSVLRRSLEELTIDASDTVLELIGQGSLYRGNEFKPIIEKFLKIQRKYKRTKNSEKDTFCWEQSVDLPSSICKIRNTSIGTLLIDLSEGKDLDRAVTAFERVVAPTNYKRPKAIITQKQIDSAKERLSELGLTDSLDRRQLQEQDLSVEDVLFVDRSKKKSDGIFGELEELVAINPKTLSKVEEVSIVDFIENILPKAKSISALVENSHLGNFVSLVGPKEPDAKTLFKWGNCFSWSYSGDVADSIKERVKSAGGNVDGDLRVSLSWFNTDDLDIHIIEPRGYEIDYTNKGKKSPTGGVLDVDMNVSGESTSPVENVTWANKSTIKDGLYKVVVNNYTRRNNNNSGFDLEIEYEGELFNFSEQSSPRTGGNNHVCKMKFKDGVMSLDNKTSSISSKEKWSINTNNFVPIKLITTSPNHWDGAVGNKHYIFALEGCKTDETVRPFFNEFLNEELMKEKRVFEVMGSKLKVDPVENELSGLGFSETVRNHLYLQVEGKFKRTIKVKF